MDKTDHGNDLFDVKNKSLKDLIGVACEELQFGISDESTTNALNCIRAIVDQLQQQIDDQNSEIKNLNERLDSLSASYNRIAVRLMKF